MFPASREHFSITYQSLHHKTDKARKIRHNRTVIAKNLFAYFIVSLLRRSRGLRVVCVTFRACFHDVYMQENGCAARRARGAMCAASGALAAEISESPCFEQTTIAIAKRIQL